MDDAKEQMAIRYVMGELTSSEEERFRAELALDQELSQATREMGEAFASLALTAPPKAAPAGLPDKIIGATANVRPREVSSFWNFVPWALAACLAAMCALLASEWVQSQRNLVAAQDKLARSNEEVATLRSRNALAQIRIATLQSLVDSFARTNAVVVWDPDKKSGVIQFSNLPAPAPGKNYQLWVVDPKSPQPISAGLVPASESGLVKVNFKPAHAIASAGKFAVSLENTGESQTPSQIVLLGQ
jgi:anti-sigma-K factor RskA